MPETPVPQTTKIATCCYCGTRAALVLTGELRHELACRACGAPLHDLKRLPEGRVDPEAHRPPKKGRKGKRKGPVPVPPYGAWEEPLRQLARGKTRKKKRGTSLGRRVLGEAFDLIEDIFD